MFLSRRDWRAAGVAAFVLGAGLFSSSASALSFSYYGDVALTNRSHDVNKPSFMLGSVDLFSSQRVSDNSKAFLELYFNDSGDGYKLDVERLWIERTLTPTLSLGAGRIHSPLGFWNYNYHHGVFAQDTVSRPFFLQFENQDEGVFPMHMVGLFSNANWAYGDDQIHLQAALGNGPSLNTGPASVGHVPAFESSSVTDYNGGKALVGRLSYVSPKNNYQVGVFGMFNDLVESSTAAASANTSGLESGEKLYDQLITGADARYAVDAFYLMGEVFFLRSTDRIMNDTLAPVLTTHGSYSYYVQGGWHYQPDITLVARYEGNTFRSSDSYYALRKIRGEAHYVLGARYDLDDSSGLRLEYNQTVPRVGKSQSVVTLQWFFLLL